MELEWQFFLDPLFSSDAPLDSIYKHTGFTSVISDSFSSPTVNPSGLTWDGINIYSADAISDEIYKHTGFTSVILDSFSSPSDYLLQFPFLRSLLLLPS